MADPETSHAIRFSKSYFKKGGELIINYQLEYYEKKSYKQFVFYVLSISMKHEEIMLFV